MRRSGERKKKSYCWKTFRPIGLFYLPWKIGREKIAFFTSLASAVAADQTQYNTYLVAKANASQGGTDLISIRKLSAITWSGCCAR